MRISTGQAFDNQRKNVSANYAEMVKWQTQLSSGKRISKLSDDPFQAGVLLRKKALHNTIEQYNVNLRTAKDYTGNSENVLTDMQSILKKGYELSIQGATSTMDQTARLSLADQVNQMQRRLVDLANSRGSQEQYLFAGQMTDTQPYTLNGTTLQYNGDANAVRIEIGPNQTMKVNTLGGTDFVNAYNALESLKTNLTGGNIGALSGIDVPALKGQVDRFSQLRSEAGAAMQQAKDLESANLRRMDDLTEGISTIEDVDFAEAVSNLTKAQTAYQAALQVSANSFRLSLMDYLR